MSATLKFDNVQLKACSGSSDFSILPTWSQPGTTPAQGRTALGFGGTVTVAELNAAGADARSAMYYCSDCLTPEGVGAPVVWSGTKWLTTCSGIPATTDLLTYFRGVRTAGKEFYTSAGKLTRFCRNPELQNPAAFTVSGDGAAVGYAFDGEGATLATGTTNAGVARIANYADAFIVNGAVNGGTTASVYFAAEVHFSALSTATEEYLFRLGFSMADAKAGYLSTDEATLVYDRADALGFGGGNVWVALTRKGSIDTPSVLVAAPATSYATRQLCEVLLTPEAVTFAINGATVATHTTNVPAAPPTIVLRPNISIKKTAGTTERAVRFHRMFCGLRLV